MTADRTPPLRPFNGDAIPQALKTCSKCGEAKALPDFPPKKSTCKTCISVFQKAYRAANAEKRKEDHRRYYQDNREALAAKNKAWAEANIDKVRAAGMRSTRAYRGRNPEKIKAQLHEYTVSNLDKVSAKAAKQKAREIGAMPAWADASAILKVYTDAKELRALVGSVDVDHIVPLQSRYVCGLHVHQNLEVITESENRRKSNTHWPDMWPITNELRQLAQDYQESRS